MGPDEESSRLVLLSGKAVECLRFSPPEVFALEGWTDMLWRKCEGVLNGAGNKGTEDKEFDLRKKNYMLNRNVFASQVSGSLLGQLSDFTLDIM